MYLKIHEQQGKKIIAVCDKELIGKILTDGNAYLDLDKYRGFYVGKLSSENEVKKSLKSFSSANIVGKNAVNMVLNVGLADKKDVMYINKIPYIQIYSV